MSGQLPRMVINCLNLRIPRFCAIVLLLPLIVSCNTVKLIDPDTGATAIGYLYLPSEEGPSPGVIVLHGAGGLRSNHLSFASNLSEEGYVVLVVKYQITENGRKRDKREYIDAGYKFLRSHPAVDMERMGMVGFSRGATYTMGFSRNDWIPDYEKNIAGIVLYYIGAKPNYFYDENLPPALFLHGDKDEYLRIAYISAFCGVQESRAKKPCKYHFYEGVRHGFDYGKNNNSAAKKDAFMRAVNFLDQYVKGKAPSPPQSD